MDNPELIKIWNERGLVLASASPRRQQILEAAGFRFGVHPADIPEESDGMETAEKLVRRLAEEKAEHVSGQIPGERFCIGADTVVELEGVIFGKPVSVEDAKLMIGKLSGRTHRVYTGVSLVQENRVVFTFHEISEVTFGIISGSETDAYVKTGDPMSRAGAYGIQDYFGIRNIRSINGDYWNVVGFPLHRFLAELGGISIPD